MSQLFPSEQGCGAPSSSNVVGDEVVEGAGRLLRKYLILVAAAVTDTGERTSVAVWALERLGVFLSFSLFK